MSWTKGFSFRNTSGYVTDAANDTYVLDDGAGNGEQYPVTRNGVTFGYTLVAGVNTRDRNSGNDARLAGIHFPGSEELHTFRVDLTATGNYNVALALGDASYAHTIKAVVKDNGSALLTINAATASSNHFLDASATDRTAAAWPGSNTPASLTFASTIAQLVYGGGSDLSTVAHISFDQQAAAARGHGLRLAGLRNRHVYA